MYTIKITNKQKIIGHSIKNKGIVLFNVFFLSSRYCPVFFLKGRSFTRAHGKIQSFLPALDKLSLIQSKAVWYKPN